MEDFVANGFVEFCEYLRVNLAAQASKQRLALLGRNLINQVGDICNVERRDKHTRTLVIAFLGSGNNFADEVGR